MATKLTTRLVQTQVRLSTDEKEAIRRQAAREGLDLSKVARRALRAGWRNLYGRPLGRAGR